MKPVYFSLTFLTGDNDQEIWMAMLSEWPFESFHEEERKLTAYLLQSEYTDPLKSFIQSNKGIWFDEMIEQEVKEQNWNEVWESSFNPVAVETFCYIRAMFHHPAPAGFTHEIIIAPRMAFGTGHHATTYMMLHAMSKINFTGKMVLDFGCGTGILSVVAAMEGAREVIGVDIQPEAIENSYEHAILNHVEPVCHFIEGGLAAVPHSSFDIILANINSKIIIGHFEALKHMLNPGGSILLSGIMTADMPEIDRTLDLPPLQKAGQQQREDWIQLTLELAAG